MFLREQMFNFYVREICLFFTKKEKKMIYNYKYINNLSYHNFKNYFLFINKKYTHTLSNKKKSIIYIDSLFNKPNILKENKNKSGIYKWTLSIDNKSYIGSSNNITKRLRKYYCLSYLNNKIIKDNSRIYRALLKHGYSNFNLEILEYCNKESLINREQYYIDLLKPEYNICKIAGSMLGFKHSEKTLLQFKNRDTGTGYVTIVINKDNNLIKIYKSIRTAAKSIGVSHTTIIRYFNKNKLLKDIYFIKSKDNE
jgi:hypothetical protein